jgi:hypothetical protein
MNTNFPIVNPSDFTYINSDRNGNHRYTIHFKKLLSSRDIHSMNRHGASDAFYRVMCKRANQIGGRKYTGSKFGGLIVFTSDSLMNLCIQVNLKFA